MVVAAATSITQLKDAIRSKCTLKSRNSEPYGIHSSQVHI